MSKVEAKAELPTLQDNFTYLFMEDFDPKTVKPVIDWILRCNFMKDSQRPERLQLIINSPGGCVNSAMALIDVIKGSVIPVHTLGIGQISSCGLLTFMSGAKGHRVLTPNTSILSHQYSWGSHGKSHELMARVKEFDLTSARLIALYKHCTGLTETKIREVLLPPQDVWLTAQEAVELGVADAIKATY